MNALLKATGLTLLLWSVVASAAAQRPGPAILLVGQGAAMEVPFIYYQNEFQDQVSVRLEFDSATGHWRPLRLATSHPLWLQLSNTSDQYALYAQPGDTIYIQTHPGQTPYYTFHSPDGRPGRQAELNFFTALRQRRLDMSLPDFVGLFLNTRYPRQVERLCVKFDQRLGLLQRYRDSLRISPVFFEYAVRQIQAQYLSAVLYPYWDKEQAFRQFPTTYAQLVEESGAARYLRADSLVLTSPTYRSAAVSYVRYLSRDSVGTATELATQYHQARAALQGKTRDYALFFLLKQNLGKHLATYTTFLEQFRHDCTTPAYVRYLDSLVARPALLPQQAKLLQTALKSSTGETLTWSQLLARNQGKVLYLDLWASWCGPCLAEMPASAVLQQELADQPVQFIYLSLDRDSAKWQQALAQHQLARPGTQHYLLDEESALAKFLNAPPIPRYVLLDKQGRVAALDAARPSNSLLRADLAKLLK